MKFVFENLGLLERAEIDLSDLTIICGENNTGKTYATYAIHGFLRSWRRILQNIIVHEIVGNFGSQKSYRLDLDVVFRGKINEYLSSVANQYLRNLPRVFAARKDAFPDTRLVVSIDTEQDLKRSSYQRQFRKTPTGKVLATIKKEANSPILEVLVDDSEMHAFILNDFVADAVTDIVFSPHLPRVHISSAERTGAAIFRKELDMARTRMLKALTELDSKELKNPFALQERIRAADYAWPVEDNVDFVRQLEDIDKTAGELATQMPELLGAFDAVIGGTYKVVKDTGLVFQAKGGGRQRFTMNESSSCVRALLDIGFYLRCRAKRGDLFIIDEPELNLHPKNQRALARLLARLINAGVKVFITTHSDYLVKECNTLIMLHQKTKHTKAIQEREGYDDAELIDPDRVRLYITGTEKKPADGKGRRATQINALIPAKIDPGYGIEVTTFDDTIETMNRIQSDILYGGEL